MTEAYTQARRIPHSRPTLGIEDERAVAEAVASGTLVNGPRLRSFESDLARCLHRKDALAVTSGSAALHLALLAVGAGPGDQIAVPSYTCISVLQAVRRAGAEPLLVDCDPATFHMDFDDLKQRLGRRTRAILVVHTFGLPLSMEPFLSIGPPVVEDVATALGARRDGRPSGAEGGCAVCSFNATKMITTGGGGAIAADDPGFVSRIKDLVDYDAREDAAVRYNERMGEVAAALGLSQLSRLRAMLGRRREIARIYREELAGTSLGLPPHEIGSEPTWHRFVVRVAGGADRLRAALEAAGIASPHPIHQPLHEILGRGGFPGSRSAHQEALSLPIYPSLADEDVRRVAREVQRCLNHA